MRKNFRGMDSKCNSMLFKIINEECPNYPIIQHHDDGSTTWTMDAQFMEADIINSMIRKHAKRPDFSIGDIPAIYVPTSYSDCLIYLNKSDSRWLSYTDEEIEKIIREEVRRYKKSADRQFKKHQ